MACCSWVVDFADQGFAAAGKVGVLGAFIYIVISIIRNTQESK